MGKEISIEVAATPFEREFGLQYAKSLPEMSGMLFKFDKNSVLNFWMKNTYLPLEIAFVNDEDIVVKTEKMVPLSLRSISSEVPCRMALEVPTGTLDKANCVVGSKLKVDWESKRVTFSDPNNV
jgi:uncharacterized membrane protein (UPF0127 family)